MDTLVFVLCLPCTAMPTPFWFLWNVFITCNIIVIGCVKGRGMPQKIPLAVDHGVRDWIELDNPDV